jgi:hypothetical protein
MKVEYNLHSSDYRNNTIEFNVKYPTIPESITEDILEYEWSAGHFINSYSDELYGKIIKKYKWVVGWSFSGRMNGWFVLEVSKDPSMIRQSSIDGITQLVERYYENYGKRLAEFYKEVA